MKNSHAIFLGLNKVNPKNYAGWDGKLNGCINDVKYFKKLIKLTGFSEMLLDNKATYENLEKAILYIAQLATINDHTFIIHSGHGASLPDRNGDEIDKKDEAICLFNGMLLDDTFSKLIDIIPGSVYVYSDSCHSGTNTKDFFAQAYKVKEIKNVDFSKIAIKSPGLLGNKAPKILTMAASKDDQVSYDKGNHGAFTECVISIIEKAKGKINYEDMMAQAVGILKDSDTPQTPELNSYRSVSIRKEICFV